MRRFTLATLLLALGACDVDLADTTAPAPVADDETPDASGDADDTADESSTGASTSDADPDADPCGNGRLDPGETCDDGEDNDVNGWCMPAGLASGQFGAGHASHQRVGALAQVPCPLGLARRSFGGGQVAGSARASVGLVLRA